jgi:clan AA aspartic protease (TIGR02281 family)
MKIITAVASMVMVAVFALTAYGALFQYTDANGVVSIVDDIDKMPSSYKAREKQKTAITVDRNRIRVPVSIRYKGRTIVVRLILDTGASDTVITPSMAQRLGINLGDTTQGVSMIADGSKVTTYNVIADSVTVGPKTIRGIKLSILPNKDSEDQGLLGMNFLNEFPHMINMRARTINWQ